jgi:hypothetical protein
MTPKEKAEDLLYQMRYDHMSGPLTKRKAKQCALIALDLLLYYSESPEALIEFEEIEKEIEKL